jgi:hypothetical protein
MEGMADIFSFEGHVVVDCVGNQLGRVEKICAGEGTSRPQWARVELDVLGKGSTFVPLVGAEPAGDDLRIAYKKETVIDALESEATSLHHFYGAARERPQLPPGREPLAPPPRWP